MSESMFSQIANQNRKPSITISNYSSINKNKKNQEEMNLEINSPLKVSSLQENENNKKNLEIEN